MIWTLLIAAGVLGCYVSLVRSVTELNSAVRDDTARPGDGLEVVELPRRVRPRGGVGETGAATPAPDRAGRAAPAGGQRAARPVRITRRGTVVATATAAAVLGSLLWCFPYVVVTR